MKARRLFGGLSLFLACVLHSVSAQVTESDNNIIVNTSYVGCDGASLYPLRLMHSANHEVELWTDTIQRIELNPTTSYVVNPAQGAKTADGWTLISPDIAQFFANGAPGPYSLLHLAAADNNAQLASDREWMDVGLTITGNGDHGYMGQKANGLDRTDMIAHWSDNPATFYGPDRYRWLFTSGYNGSNATGAQSDEGLEAMRIYPVSNDECFIGMGDWFAANVADPTITEPEERLDVVDGRVRIRQLPTEAVMDTTDKFVVVNDDGVLGWQNVAALPDNCEWSMNGASPNHVFTAVGSPSGSCPDDLENVGIGLNSPFAKLDVLRKPTSSHDYGVQIYTYGDNNGTFNVGLSSIVSPASNAQPSTDHVGVSTRTFDGSVRNYGVFGRAWLNTGKTTTDNIGVFGECVFGTDLATNSYGVKGYSQGLPSSKGFGVHGYVYTTPSDSDHTVLLAGVYGSIQHSNYANRWAAYFVGKGYIPTGFWSGSDPALKQNINELEGALDILSQIDPKTYEFRTADYPHMGLPDGIQRGVLSTEIESILPDLVTTVTHPAEIDSLGNVLHPAVTFKAVKYDGFIPLLIGGVKEQEAKITALEDALTTVQDQIAAMQQDLAACCEGRSMIGPGGGSSDGQSTGAIELRVSDAADQRLTITPNPFNEGTVIGYTLPKAGMVSLQVSDATGKSLFNLFEGQQMEGAQRYDWNTSFLAPGMYHVTLLVDGQPLVKKAVKVAR